MALDLRPPMAPFVEAFGVPITVRRPVPDDADLVTTGIWGTPLIEDQPFGSNADFQRREPRKVMAIPLDSTLTSVPRGTRIVAAEALGETERLWVVDGLARAQEVDAVHVILRPVQD